MRSFYDDPDFFFTVQDLWSQVQPLYKQLFTFVRKGLVKFYGDKLIRKDGPIPAHVLGNVWAQDWRNIMDLVNTGRSHIPNISDELIRQGYTPLRIFQAAEEFFTSMGLPPMLPEFWRNSLLQRPSDTFKDCSAPSSWDFCNNVDFRYVYEFKLWVLSSFSLMGGVAAPRTQAFVRPFVLFPEIAYSISSRLRLLRI